jgi:uncharacterized protein YggE/predicted small secreted protein
MRARPIALLIALVALAAVLAAACGGDGAGEQVSIRTQKGLGVAALVANAQAKAETDDESGAAPAAPDTPVPDTAVGTERSDLVAPEFAPYPYQALQESQTGITVQGYGSASADADSAVLELYFGGTYAYREGIEPVPEPAEPDSGQSEPSSGGVAPGAPETDLLQPAQPITEADLQPVVDAVAAQGVSADDIEVIVQPSYGDPYYGGSATIRVTVRNVDALEGIVSTATEAASGLENISFNGSSVSYTVSDCAALELAAMRAAVEDARERGQTFASALGVGLGAVVGASHYSYSPFGSPCDAGTGGPYPLGGIAYAEGQSPEVQLVATVTITFAIQ